MIGEIISHYRIIQSLGAGGMGEVYLAEDTTLGRRVALKLLPRDHTQDQDRLLRFKQEAKSASALNHPNILTVHEFGEAGGRHFIATEFIDGETLRALLKRSSKMETSEALRIATHIASALAAAHEAGIVHRDIKPENIMIRRDGYVKVLDFGLAKLTETVVSQTADTSLQTASVAAHTETGIVMGTAHYMSPEQATGNQVDARSDVFSFGAVLYEMMSGHRAFEGKSVVEILAATINQDPKPLPSSVAPDLVKIIQRCLRKDPARRYQTMADLKVALEDLREESHPRQNFVSVRWRWIALIAPIIVIGGWLAIYVREPLQPKTSEETLEATALTTFPGVEQSPSLSPDANHVVFAWTGTKQDNQDIYVQMIGQGSPLRLTTDPLNDYNPVWSPDGRWIAFFRSQPPAPTGLRSRELLLIPPLGGPERKLAVVRGQDFFPVAAYLAWSPDSNSLLVTDSTGEGKPDALFVVSVETGEKRQLTNPQAPVLADIAPAVSPDGRSLVFLRRTTWGAGELYLLPLEKNLTAASEPRRLTPATLRADFPAWMPDGNEIVFAAKNNLWKLAINEESTPPTRIPYVGENGLMPAISRSRPEQPTRLVYVRSFWDGNFWRVDVPEPGAPAIEPPVPAISSTKEEYHCELSPDGRRVAFSSDRSGDSEIWVSNPDGSNAIQLTFLRAQETMTPHWSPDGQSITFSSNPEGEFDIYIVSAAGGKPRRITSHPSIDLGPTFSRNGKWIYFGSMRSGDYRIWKMPAAGGDAVQVTSVQGARGFESPDGNSFFYHQFAVDSPLWRIPTSGGEPVKVLDGVFWFNWCLFENGVYYIDNLGPETRLHFRDFGTGKSTTIARNLGEVSAGLTVTPDGKTILFTRVDASGDDLMLVEGFQ